MRMNRFFFPPMAAALIFFGPGLSAFAFQNTVAEAEAKAAIVFNVLLFANWPQGLVRPSYTLTLCVVEDDAVEAALLGKYAGEAVGRARLVVTKKQPQPDELSACDAIFVGGSSPSDLYRAAVASRGRSVLLFGEGTQALENGAMIGLALSGGRYVIDVNLTGLRRENLSVSSKLLRLARRVIE